MFAKLTNGNIERLRMPLKTNSNDIFTNDESIIRANGYKEVIYTQPMSETAVPHWEETETNIIQVWAES